MSLVDDSVVNDVALDGVGAVDAVDVRGDRDARDDRGARSDDRGATIPTRRHDGPASALDGPRSDRVMHPVDGHASAVDGVALAADAVIPGRRHVVNPHADGRAPDRAAGQRAVVDLLTALGRDPSNPHLADTPRRVVDSLIELTTPEEFDFTTFPNDEHYDEMVVEVGIPIHSLCEHHLLPFTGVAHIAYIPAERILGISKLARVARMFARDLQVQERLTAQIADWLTENLHPRGVGVVIEAEHLCQSLRGVKAAGTRTVTSALRGVMRSDGRTRDEFLSLARTASR